MIILVLFFLISTILIWALKLSSLIATILYVTVPAIYLLVKYEKLRKNILIFALPTGIVFSIVSQYLGEYNDAWTWPSSTLKFATYLHVESIIWGIATIAVVLGMYRILFDYKHKHNFERNYKKLIAILFSAFLALGVWIFFAPTKLEYAYAKLFSFPMISVIIYTLVKRPYLFSRLLKLSLFFITFAVVYEILALKLGYWSFPGEYSGFVRIFDVSIPLEEFILWLALGAASIASAYEALSGENEKIAKA